MDSVDSFKDITTDEGKHECPLNIAAEGKKGNSTTNCVISVNKLYNLQNFCQGTRNAKSIGPTL